MRAILLLVAFASAGEARRVQKAEDVATARAHPSSRAMQALSSALTGSPVAAAFAPTAPIPRRFARPLHSSVDHLSMKKGKKKKPTVIERKGEWKGTPQPAPPAAPAAAEQERTSDDDPATAQKRAELQAKIDQCIAAETAAKEDEATARQKAGEDRLAELETLMNQAVAKQEFLEAEKYKNEIADIKDLKAKSDEEIEAAALARVAATEACAMARLELQRFDSAPKPAAPAPVPAPAPAPAPPKPKATTVPERKPEPTVPRKAPRKTAPKPDTPARTPYVSKLSAYRTEAVPGGELPSGRERSKGSRSTEEWNPTPVKSDSFGIPGIKQQFVDEYMLEAPPYLKDTLEGDRGMDPWCLTAFADPSLDSIAKLLTGEARKEKMLAMTAKEQAEAVGWMRNAELKHGRLAMLATAGWVFAEKFHTDKEDVLQEWTNGRAPSVFNGHLLDFIPGLLAIFGALSFLEFSTKDTVKDGNFGFDPLGFSTGKGPVMENLPAGIKKNVQIIGDLDMLKLSEIKHCRAAMMAITGFSVAECVWGVPVIRLPISSIFFR